jgi:hypothetical protein
LSLHEALDLELIKVAASTVRDFNLLFAFILDNQPFKRAVTNALKGNGERGKSQRSDGLAVSPKCAERPNRLQPKAF